MKLERTNWPHTQRAFLLVGLSIMLGPPFPVAVLSGQTANRVSVPGKLFRAPAEKKALIVNSFFMDRYAVTNSDFSGFTSAHPEWRRSKVKGIFADEGYLRHWSQDEGPGPDAPGGRSPVTNVSWFAARAYCHSKSGRLPTQMEWERAASEPLLTATGGSGPSIESLVLTWYEVPAVLPLPVVGSTYANRLGIFDLHGLIWEWVEDFNALPATGDSRTGIDRSLFCAGGAGAGINPVDYVAYMRYAFRNSLQARFAVQNLGFRCAYGKGDAR